MSDVFLSYAREDRELADDPKQSGAEGLKPGDPAAPT
jgi:hypothetical protein